QILMTLQRYQDVNPAITKVLSLTPENAKAWYLVAQLQMKQERYKNAIESIDKSIDYNNEKDIDTYYLKYKALSFLQHYEKAIEVLDQMIQINPEDNGIYHRKIGVLQKLRHYGKAIEVLDQLIQINPKNVSLYLQKIQTLETLR